MFSNPMFSNEEVFEFMMHNPATGARLAYAKVHTQSMADFEVAVRAETVEDICKIKNGYVLFVEWKDGGTAVYYKKCDKWVLVLSRI